AVLYEMITGKKAFEAKSQASLIAAILEREPPLVSVMQPLVPPALERLVRKSLAKDSDARWQNAHDLLDELRWIVASGMEHGGVPYVAVVSRARLRKAVFTVAWCLLLVAAAALAFVAGRRSQVSSELRFLIPTTALLEPSDNALAVSPDGRFVAFVASTQSKT